MESNRYIRRNKHLFYIISAFHSLLTVFLSLLSFGKNRQRLALHPSLWRGRGKLSFTLFLLCITFFTSCKDNEADNIDEYNKQTILVYLPWSGDNQNTGLYNIFLQNIDSIKSGIINQKGLKSSRLVIFISHSAQQSELYEIKYEHNQFKKVPIKEYSGNFYTHPEGIAQIINDTKNAAQALNYAMIIGCHGTGWTYKDSWNQYPYSAKLYFYTRAKRTTPLPHTRFFGSVNDYNNYATNIDDLAKGIKLSHTKLQYLLFDDCYMANIETAYTLRKATNFLIASTSEIMSIGMPYAQLWSSLATPTPQYENITKLFYDFYSHYDYPYGSLAAIDCREVEALAHIMHTINQQYSFPENMRDSLQILDGFSPTIFYDLGNYVDILCPNKALKEQFNQQLNKVVRSKQSTKIIYTGIALNGTSFINVKSFSGLTTSAPSLHIAPRRGLQRTEWWKATHK